MQGVIKGICGLTVMLELDRDIEFPEGEIVDIEIKKHREKRSLNANAYFHVLVDKLRTKLRISFTECKNDLITSYGQIEYIDGQQVVIKTNIPTDQMRKSEVLHCLCVKADKEVNRRFNGHTVIEDVTEVYFYRVYRGSHTYDSREMAQLIDGTIEECKLQGVETMTPDELARLEGYEKYSH